MKVFLWLNSPLGFVALPSFDNRNLARDLVPTQKEWHKLLADDKILSNLFFSMNNIEMHADYKMWTNGFDEKMS